MKPSNYEQFIHTGLMYDDSSSSSTSSSSDGFFNAREIDDDIKKLTQAIESQHEGLVTEDAEEQAEDKATRSSLETCLELSRKKQKVLKEHISKIDNMIKYNEGMENKLEKFLIHDAMIRGTCPWLTKAAPNRQLYKPYFKDNKMFPPPRNRDTIVKKRNREVDVGCIVSTSKWQRWEMKLLDDVARENAFEILLAPLTARKERLQEQINDATKLEQDTTELQDKLEELQHQINDLADDPLFEMLSNPNAKIDWMKISATDFDGRRTANECRAMWRMCLMVGVKRTRWMKQETDQLMTIARLHHHRDWEQIAEELGGGRTAYQCFLHYQITLNRQRYKWTPSEDRRLKFLISKYRKHGDKIPFALISRHMPGRTVHHIRQRWHNSLDPEIRFGKFSVQEDLLLATARHVHNLTFRQIACLLRGRTEAQLRTRYKCLENVQPTLPFTPEEDRRLVAMAQQEGQSWSSLVRDFPNRNRAQLRNRYMRLIQNAKTRSTLVTYTSLQKGRLWQTLKDKIKPKMELKELCDDTLSLVTEISKPSRQGRKAKHRDRIDIEISQIFRSHYAQKKGRRKKHFSSEDLAIIGSKGRQVADMLKANVDWTADHKHEDEGQRQLFEQLRAAHNNTGWDCSSRSLERALPPNVATIVGLRSLLLVEPFLLRWSFDTSDNTRKQVDNKIQVPSSGNALDFRQACHLFKQRCLALFLWPMILSQRGPPRMDCSDVFHSTDVASVRSASKDKEKVPAKPKLTKVQRKRWLKARWQKYRDEKQGCTKAQEHSSSAVVKPVAVKPVSLKRKQPGEDAEGQSPAPTKKQRGSVRNKQGKHVPGK